MKLMNVIYISSLSIKDTSFMIGMLFETRPYTKMTAISKSRADRSVIATT